MTEPIDKCSIHKGLSPLIIIEEYINKAVDHINLSVISAANKAQA